MSASSHTDKPIHDTFYILKSVNNVIKIILNLPKLTIFYSYIFYNPPWISRLQKQYNANKRKKNYVGIFTAVPKLKKKLKSVIKQFLYPISKNKVQKRRCTIYTSSPSWNKELLKMNLYFTASSRDRTRRSKWTSNELLKNNKAEQSVQAILLNRSKFTVITNHRQFRSIPAL